ncbi:MAG: ATP-binding protein [Limisphaerales bacterium]|jgi:PAS domain S-box-containing protein
MGNLNSSLLLLALTPVDSSTATREPQSVLTDVTSLLWLLIIPVGLILAGVLWLALVRRETQRQSTIASRRKAELDAWYRDLFDNAHDILLTLDGEGRLLSLNKAGIKLLGWNQEQSPAPSLVEWIATTDRERFQTMLQELRQGAAMAHGEITLVPAPDSSTVWRMNLRHQHLPGKDAEIRGVAWDVTAQRRAQDALRESEHRLRHSLEERIRIGRDLHDGIIQSIYAVGLSLGQCRRLITTNADTAQQRLDETIRDLNGIIREVRSFIEGLEPEALKGREFQTAIETAAGQLGVANRAEWSLNVDIDAANALSAAQAAGLLQITREALSNALRHSSANRISTRLSQPSADSIRLEITDDGRGFDPALPARQGLGLRNLQERTRELGGRFELISSPGQGTTIRIHLNPNHQDGTA